MEIEMWTRIASMGTGSFLPGEGWERQFSYGDRAIFSRMGIGTRMEMRTEMATLGTRMGKKGLLYRDRIVLCVLGQGWE